MKVVKISVFRSAKMPMPNVRFGMCEMFASAEAEVGEEDLTQAYTELVEIVRTELKRQYDQWSGKEPIGEASI